MTTLRERLAQMGEVARNAAEPTFGGRWACSRERHDGTAHVYSPSSGPLRQATPVAETNPIFGAHIATFSPDVAAALVAVADAVAALPTCPLCGFPNGAHYRGDGLRKYGDACQMHALAAAMGVSR